jgi:hypothetical protein
MVLSPFAHYLRKFAGLIAINLLIASTNKMAH